MSPVIRAIEAILVDLPTVRAHRLAMTTMARQTLVIVRLRCSDNVEGIGEATTIGGLSYGVESPESIRITIECYLAPLLIGQPADNINVARTRMARHVRGNTFAKSALETALLDAQGKRLGLPVSALLGGAQHAHLPVLWTLASGEAATDIAEAERLIDEGRHDRFKLKIGAGDIQADLAHVNAIRRGLPAQASLRVDVNQAWSESQARPAIAALERAGIDLVEQPVGARQAAALVRLSQRFDTALMADEAVCDIRDGFQLAQAGFVGAVALKIAKAGGPLGALELAAAATAGGLELYGGTMLEGTIGTVASLHAWSTVTAMRWGTEMFGPLLLTDDIVTEPLTYADGGVAVPSTPGLGVALDEDKLEHYRRDGGGRGRSAVAVDSPNPGVTCAVQG